MNNNSLSERAHLGVFSASSYTSIGDPYGKKAVQDDRMKGVQFQAEFPKSGIAGARLGNVLFDRQHKWLYQNGEKCAPPLRAQRPSNDHAALAHAPARTTAGTSTAPCT